LVSASQACKAEKFIEYEAISLIGLIQRSLSQMLIALLQDLNTHWPAAIYTAALNKNNGTPKQISH